MVGISSVLKRTLYERHLCRIFLALRSGITGALIGVCLLFWPSIAMAHKVTEVEKNCPVCGTTFKTEMASGTSFSMRLDLKPLGAIVAPLPIPVCPECSFVLYKYTLTGEEREKLMGFLKSPQYRQLIAEKHTSYYLLANILTFMGFQSFDIAYAYLKASWQTEQLDSKRHHSYLESCLASLRDVPKKGKEWLTAQMLIGEMLRQLGKFDEAGQHFHTIAKEPEFRKQPYRTMVHFEIQLIASKDSSPREIPEIVLTEEEKKEMPAYRMCYGLEGYDRIKKLFTVKKADLGCINMLPYSLHVKLGPAGNGGRLVNAAWWFNPVDEQKNKARYDWNDFIDVYTEVNAVVSRHHWLSEWRGISPNRTIEAQIFGIRPYTETGLEKHVTPAWKHAGLNGEPFYEVNLRRGGTFCGTVFFDREDSRALITAFSRGDGDHWLDKVELFYHYTQEIPEYVVVQCTGKWLKNTNKKDDPHCQLTL